MSSGGHDPVSQDTVNQDTVQSDSVCHDEVCITCADAAVPVLVVELLPDDLAIVDTGAGREEVSVALVSATAGDTILVHAREAIAVIQA